MVPSVFVLLKKPHAGFLPPTLPCAGCMEHLEYQLTWFFRSGRLCGQGASAAPGCQHWRTGPAHRFVSGWEQQKRWIYSNTEKLSEEEKEIMSFNERDAETTFVQLVSLMSLFGWTWSQEDSIYKHKCLTMCFLCHWNKRMWKERLEIRHLICNCNWNRLGLLSISMAAMSLLWRLNQNV